MKRLNLFLLILIILFPMCVCALDDNNDEVIDSNKVSVKLDSCVDGDTAKFLLDNGSVIKVRFLAIDTPETVHPTKDVEAYGKDASQLTCKILTDASDIVLEYDEGSTKTDKYGRELAWVFADGVLVQDSLIAKGYAKVAYLYGNYKYTGVLQSSEEIAKNNKIGIWSDEMMNTTDTTNTGSNEEANIENSNPIIAFFDDLLASILDFFNDILDSILNFIESVL